MTIQEFENYIKEKNKKQIIFDFDGTICDLLINWEKWKEDTKEAASFYGVEFDSGYVGYAETQNRCIKKGGEEAKNKILELNYKSEKDFYTGYEILPVALPLLESAKNLAKVYLWTSNDKRTILPLLSELKIDSFFEKVIARNDVTYIKPNPEGFYKIYDEKNPKEEYLFIGDSQADEEAAKNAGVDFINIAEFEK